MGPSQLKYTCTTIRNINCFDLDILKAHVKIFKYKVKKIRKVKYR